MFWGFRVFVVKGYRILGLWCLEILQLLGFKLKEEFFVVGCRIEDVESNPNSKPLIPDSPKQPKPQTLNPKPQAPNPKP